MNNFKLKKKAVVLNLIKERVRCGFAASWRRLVLCLQSFCLAKACALAFCFSCFFLEEASGEEPEANGNHSSARVGELCLLGEDPIFFLCQILFLRSV